MRLLVRIFPACTASSGVQVPKSRASYLSLSREPLPPPASSLLVVYKDRHLLWVRRDERPHTSEGETSQHSKHGAHDSSHAAVHEEAAQRSRAGRLEGVAGRRGVLVYDCQILSTILPYYQSHTENIKRK